MEPCYSGDRVTLYNADALAVLASLPTASADALITDPPYSSGGLVRGDRTQGAASKYVGFGSKGGTHADFTGDNRDQRSYGYWASLWLGEALRVVRPGGVVLLFTDWRQLPATSDAMQSGGWVWRGIVPWVKPFARPIRGRFKSQAEYVLWGSAGPMPLEGACLPGFFQGAAPRERDHMTQKPLDVMRGLMQIVADGGTVLDPFAGSGTTGVAALLEGRSFVGSEISQHYATVAAKRLRDAVNAEHQDQLDLEGGAA